MNWQIRAGPTSRFRLRQLCALCVSCIQLIYWQHCIMSICFQLSNCSIVWYFFGEDFYYYNNFLLKSTLFKTLNFQSWFAHTTTATIPVIQRISKRSKITSYASWLHLKIIGKVLLLVLLQKEKLLKWPSQLSLHQKLFNGSRNKYRKISEHTTQTTSTDVV